MTFSTSEPKPGWVDNFNGPVGLAIGIITGILHVVYMDPDLPKDSMPCDYVINGLLVSVWYKGTSNLQEWLVTISTGLRCPFTFPSTVYKVMQMSETKSYIIDIVSA